MAKRNIEILLTKNVFKLGNMGDIVKVKPGFARNYLFPGGMGIPADQAAKRQIEILQERAIAQDKDRKSQAERMKAQLAGVSIQVAANVSHDRQLFGSVGARDIAEKLSASGIAVEANNIALHENIKELGKYEVRVQLHSEVEVTVKVEVVNADPNAVGLDEVLEAATAPETSDDAAAADASAE